jgi:hypothetical protein
MFRGEVVIPFAYEECLRNENFVYTKEMQKGGFLLMIRRDSSGSAKWLITPPHCLGELQLWKKIKKASLWEA